MKRFNPQPDEHQQFLECASNTSPSSLLSPNPPPLPYKENHNYDKDFTIDIDDCTIKTYHKI